MREQRECQVGDGGPLLGRQQTSSGDLLSCQRLVVAAIQCLGRRRDDRRRQLLVLAQAIGKADPVDLPPTCLVHRPDRCRGRPGQIVPNHDFDRHDCEPAANQNIGVGVFDDVVRTDLARRIEPEPGDLGQHLPLERDCGNDPVEGAQPVGRDDDAAPVRQVVIVTNLTPVMVWKFRDRGVRQDVVEMRRERTASSIAGSDRRPGDASANDGRHRHRHESRRQAAAMEAGMGKPAMEAAAESAVPTPATTPPAAPAPADIDPDWPTPAPARPAPAGRCPARVPPTPARGPPTRTRVPNPARVTGAPSPRIRCG